MINKYLNCEIGIQLIFRILMGNFRVHLRLVYLLVLAFYFSYLMKCHQKIIKSPPLISILYRHGNYLIRCIYCLFVLFAWVV